MWMDCGFFFFFGFFGSEVSFVTALWTSALNRLSSKIAPHNFELWLRPIECLGIDGDRLRLRAPNHYVKLWFESNYLAHVLEELRREDDRAFKVEIDILDVPATATPVTHEDAVVAAPLESVVSTAIALPPLSPAELGALDSGGGLAVGTSSVPVVVD